MPRSRANRVRCTRVLWHHALPALSRIRMSVMSQSWAIWGRADGERGASATGRARAACILFGSRPRPGRSRRHGASQLRQRQPPAAALPIIDVASTQLLYASISLLHFIGSTKRQVCVSRLPVSHWTSAYHVSAQLGLKPVVHA